ncbi:hypothetical protein CCAX7_53690 [Capsulimonas corticalis]|uniref:Uncharacterized protein n=1 Tax=Capsulimonas corticalis TaxID=2219043 RepID=A0A402CNS8_9BACT|nr:hypothetical protein [Capsulimonas corticalis]BDI33318.1 hypothetical protein CCAX7_53690 [Capsulimonas corticalis]
MNAEGDLTAHPTHTVVVHGEPSAVEPVTHAVAGIAKPGDVGASRLAVPGETFGPNEIKTTGVQISIPSGVPPEVASNVAKDLAGHPDLLDRNGGPLISNPIVYHDVDGNAVIHASSLDSQQNYGTTPEDFATDIGDKSDDIQRILDSYGPPTALSVHPTVTTLSAAPETAASVLDSHHINTGDNANAAWVELLNVKRRDIEGCTMTFPMAEIALEAAYGGEEVKSAMNAAGFSWLSWEYSQLE